MREQELKDEPGQGASQIIRVLMCQTLEFGLYPQNMEMDERV